MRVLSIGNFTTGWDGSICDEEHIAKALEEFGVEVIRFQRENQVSGGYKHPSAYLDIDFVLLAQWDGYDADFIKSLQKPLVYWAFDYQADGQEWHEKLIAASDLYLSKRIADSRYPNWRWLSQDFAPSFLHPFDEVEQDIDVLFTGTYIDYATERNSLLKLVDDNFNLTIHSITPDRFIEQGFKNVHGPIVDHGLPELYARAKINLSLDAVVEAGYWSDRNFQIMRCRGFVLFRYVPLSEATFKDGVMYFYHGADLLEKIALYLNHDEERKTIAQEGFFMSETAWSRVQELLIIVGSVL